MSGKKVTMSIIGIILLIIIILFVRKIYLIDKIMKNLEKNNEITNYKVQSADGHYRNIFLTNGRTVAYLETDKYGDNSIYYYMNNDEQHKSYTFFYDKKIYHEIPGTPYIVENQLTSEVYEEMTFKDKIVALFTWKIGSEKIEGKKCYYICKDIDKVKAGHEYEFWIDSETYCKVKATTKEDIMSGEPEETVYYYNIEINTVGEKDMPFPDISQFEKEELIAYPSDDKSVTKK